MTKDQMQAAEERELACLVPASELTQSEPPADFAHAPDLWTLCSSRDERRTMLQRHRWSPERYGFPHANPPLMITGLPLPDENDDDERADECADALDRLYDAYHDEVGWPAVGTCPDQTLGDAAAASTETTTRACLLIQYASAAEARRAATAVETLVAGGALPGHAKHWLADVHVTVWPPSLARFRALAYEGTVPRFVPRTTRRRLTSRAADAVQIATEIRMARQTRRKRSREREHAHSPARKRTRRVTSVDAIDPDQIRIFVRAPTASASATRPHHALTRSQKRRRQRRRQQMRASHSHPASHRVLL